MQQQITLKLLPSQAVDNNIVKDNIATSSGIKPGEITGFTLLKRSIDARGKQVYINLTLKAYINEPFI